MKHPTGVIVSIMLCGILVFSGLFYLAVTIRDAVFSSPFPTALSVDTGDSYQEPGDYMTSDMAAEYIGMYDYGRFRELLYNGTFEGTYTTFTTYEGDTVHIFSKTRLDALMAAVIEEGRALR